MKRKRKEKVLNFGIRDRWIENPIPRVPPVTRAVIPWRDHPESLKLLLSAIASHWFSLWFDRVLVCVFRKPTLVQRKSNEDDFCSFGRQMKRWTTDCVVSLFPFFFLYIYIFLLKILSSWYFYSTTNILNKTGPADVQSNPIWCMYKLITSSNGPWSYWQNDSPFHWQLSVAIVPYLFVQRDY